MANPHEDTQKRSQISKKLPNPHDDTQKRSQISKKLPSPPVTVTPHLARLGMAVGCMRAKNSTTRTVIPPKTSIAQAGTENKGDSDDVSGVCGLSHEPRRVPNLQPTVEFATMAVNAAAPIHPAQAAIDAVGTDQSRYLGVLLEGSVPAANPPAQADTVSSNDYLDSLGAGQEDFEHYLDVEEPLSYGSFIRARKENSERTANASTPSSAVIIVPTQAALDKVPRACAIKDILAQGTAGNIMNIAKIGNLLAELEDVSYKLSVAENASEVSSAYKALHMWGFRSGNALTKNIDQLFRILKHYLTQCDEETNRLYQPKRRKDDGDNQGRRKKPYYKTV